MEVSTDNAVRGRAAPIYIVADDRENRSPVCERLAELSEVDLEVRRLALGDYEVTKLYVEQESLEERGLTVDDLMPLVYEDEDDDWAEKPSIVIMSRADLAREMAAQDVLFNF